jgi:hypothetical protein
MFGFLKHIVAAIAAIGATATGIAHPAGTNASVGMQAGPVCVTSTAQPGASYTEPVSVKNSGNGWEKLDLSIQQINGEQGPSYEPRHAPLDWLPRSWVSLGSPGWVQAGHSASTQVTIHVPGDAARGRYETSLEVSEYAQATHGRGVTVALGASATTTLDISVGAPPPRRAFCRGLGLVGYWPWVKPLPVCKHAVRVALCRVLPLPPPVANARNCHLVRKGTPAQEAAAWAAYLDQLRPGNDLNDAHCIVDGRFLNTAAYYARTGMYRDPLGGQHGPLANARPVTGPDSWRTAGTPHWNVRPPSQATRVPLTP